MSPAPYRLILLRHGQTEYNTQGRMQGQLDTELTEVGLAQAKDAAERLAELGPRTIITSDLSRALRTAEALGTRVGVPVRPDLRLRETHLGSWQDLWHQDVDRDWPGARSTWMGDATYTPPGGESRVDVARRALPLIDELLADPTIWSVPIVLVAHGGLISTLVCALLDLPIENWHSLGGLGNCAWAQLAGRETGDEPDDIRWQLQVWNATAEVADSGVQ